MKNRKRVVVAFLLVAVLCLGIGYAALTDELTIGGTLNLAGNNMENQEAAKEWDEDIYFLETITKQTAVGKADNSKYTAERNASDYDKIDVTVDKGCLSVKGDAIEFEATIKNDNTDYAAEITWDATTDITVDKDEFFNVTISGMASGTTIDVNDSQKFKVKIELIKTPAVDITTGSTFSIKFTATTTDSTT